MLRTILFVAGVLLVLWLVLVAFVYFFARRHQATLKDAVRLVPDTLRLVRRLATDPEIPRRTRWMLWALFVFLASPIDLVPDFLPVVGYADDVIVAAWVLRRVIRIAGAHKLEQHWPGTPQGLDTLRRLLRLRSS